MRGSRRIFRTPTFAAAAKVVKTVTYYIAEVLDSTTLTCSPEHVEDPFGHWYHWGSFEQVSRLLYHAKIRQVFAEADAWLRG